MEFSFWFRFWITDILQVTHVTVRKYGFDKSRPELYPTNLETFACHR